MAQASYDEQCKNGFVVGIDEINPSTINDLLRYLQPGTHKVVIEPRTDGRFNVTIEKTVIVTGKRGKKVESTVKVAIPTRFFPGTGVQEAAFGAGLSPVDRPYDYTEKHASLRQQMNKRYQADLLTARSLRSTILTFEDSLEKYTEVSSGMTFTVYKLGETRVYTTMEASGLRIWHYIEDGKVYIMPAEKAELKTQTF